MKTQYGRVIPLAVAALVALALPQQMRAEGEAIDSELLGRLGITRPAGVSPSKLSRQIARNLKKHQQAGDQSGAEASVAAPRSVGLPVIMSEKAPLSTALITTSGGLDVALLADWDGREDLTADHGGKVDDFSAKVPAGTTGFGLTRAAISEHTIANGFDEDIFYYGDNVGNVYVSSSTNLKQVVPAPAVFAINLPTVLNAFGNLNSDDQIVITGLGINPVADLGSFFRVNGGYAAFNGKIGEILYVTFWDTGSGFRLLANGTLIRSGVLAFPIADIVSPAPAPPGIISPAGFPVQVGGAFGVAFSVFANMAGVTVDDDGSVYFQQVDLIDFTGGNVVKIRSLDQPGIPGVVAGFQDRSLATNGFLTVTTLNPVNGAYGTASGPANQVNVFTNYSGTSTTFGNIAALAAGPGNTLYAAVARSLVLTDTPKVKSMEGPFINPTALGATPAMIISFADAAGAFAPCTLPQNPITGQYVPGAAGVPIGDGFADVARAGETLTPGVNNFRVFAMGVGPNRRGTNPAVFGTTANTLKLRFRVDYTIYSGITVDEAHTVYVIAGGTPGGVGRNPSPGIGEILAFPDHNPADRRADFVDLRGDTRPNPPAAGANVGDGDSDRFDHIFWQAPLDQTSATPQGIAGLARGFLLYTNRTRPGECAGGFCTNSGIACLVDGDCVLFQSLPNGGTQGDDASSGPIVFESFDPSHQVAGGDDQVSPFAGDDSDGAGASPLAGPLVGGFEFLLANPLGDVFSVGAACGVGNGVWNEFFLNSNGSISFGAGDTTNEASVPAFRAGVPKIAPAWRDLNPNSRAAGLVNTFPVQALGFAGINNFKVRWINVPEFGHENCGSANTFSVSLLDDGTGVDENANQPLNPANPIGNNAVPFDLQEGPTALRFVREPNTGIIVSDPLRADGTGQFWFEYGAMDLLGTAIRPVLVGYSIGNQNALNPPGLCATNLSEAARAADSDPFRPSLLGEGTEPTIFEFFNTGTAPQIGPGGEINTADPAFDLRYQGNDPQLASSANQPDPNRQRVGFFGATCQLPPNPRCAAVAPQPPVVVAPGQPVVGTAAAATPNGLGQKIASPTAGIVNALGLVQLNIVGSGFAPNEATVICGAASAVAADVDGVDSPIPTQRAGKTVTSAQRLGLDTNGDGIPDEFLTLTDVTPVSKNLIRATLAPLSGAPGTAFPLDYCGGFSVLTSTTTFTRGDNNIFNLLPTGGFTRSTTCTVDVGVRAPVVTTVAPAAGECGQTLNLDIDGACFRLPNGTANVTDVYASNPMIPSVSARNFVIMSPNEINAVINFGRLNPGTELSLFATGPYGPSRNLSELPAGTPAGVPLGNELGNPVMFECQ